MRISDWSSDVCSSDLLGVTRERSDDWLTKWLKSPESMIASDPDAKALREQYPVAMPNQNLTDAEVSRYLRYFHWADENVKRHEEIGRASCRESVCPDV